MLAAACPSLRSWWRHEAQTVAAALTAARHHSAGPREEVVTRREERQEGEVLSRAVWCRRWSRQLWRPQRRRRSTLLLCPFLLTQSLAAQQQEKEDKELEADLGLQEKRLMDLVEEERRQGPCQFSRIEKAIFHWFLLKRKGEKRRKRKKRRKRRLPRSPRPLLRGRVRRRQRQWHSRYAGFPGDVSPRAVFLRSRQAQMRCIMAGLDQKDSYVMAGFSGYDVPRAVFLSVAISQVQFLKRLSCPLCATTYALVQTRRVWGDSSGAVLGEGCCARCVQRHMPGIGVQFTWRFRRCRSWTRLSCPLCATTYALVQTRSNRGDAAGAVPRQGCGHARRCVATGAGVDVQKTAELPQLQLIYMVGHTLSWRRVYPHGYSVQETFEFPLLQYAWRW